MKIFKNIDDKFKNIGFKKVTDNEYVVTYERLNETFGYTQVIDILHKKSGRHIVQSYDKHIMDEDKIGNICVGLSYYEMKLIMKKMKKKRLDRRIIWK